jgi:hypothetical protein
MCAMHIFLCIAFEVVVLISNPNLDFFKPYFFLRGFLLEDLWLFRWLPEVSVPDKLQIYRSPYS